MLSAYGIAQVQAAEAELMATLPTGELMARAVTGLAEVTRVRLREREARRIVGLIGPGNNGADALYALAALNADGYRAAALLRAEAVHAGALTAARDSGVEVHALGADGALTKAARKSLRRAEVVLDGILGIGGRPGLPEYAASWVEQVPEEAYLIAVDLPSGQDPAGEIATPSAVFADETITFSVPKPVHLLPATEAATGLLTVVDIGLDLDPGAAALRRLDRDDIARLWPVPGPGDDKYSRGVLGVIAGGEDYPGAAVLSATAAAEAGAGMVRYVGSPTPQSLVLRAVPEAVLGAGRVQAWVIGPGVDPASRRAGVKAQLEAARTALASAEPVVLDAGALDLLRGPRPAPTLLTPHAGECARMLTRLTGTDVTRADVVAAPAAHGRRLAQETQSVVLLKGATTLVLGPDGTTYSQSDAPPWLATAGAGDVLAGVAGVLAAAGMPLLEAGALAALVHGLAAHEANPQGPVRAAAVARQVPRVVAAALRAGSPSPGPGPEVA